LVNASNVPEFRPVYDALTNMAFYSFSPDVMRWPQAPDPGHVLESHGNNLAGVLAALEKRNAPSHQLIQRYLRQITPGVQGVERIAIGNLETLQFRQQVAGQKSPWRFPANNMSDGTLRALAVLTALLQGDGDAPSLIGIEEPEIALHPAAAGILWDALMDGQDRAQVLVTTHSPDLLDRKDIPINAILATDSDAGRTEIGPIIESSRELLRERLATPGELLRQRRLTPTELTLKSPADFAGTLV
jgi:predicted ATPase